MSEEPPPPGTEDIPEGFPVTPAVEPVPSTTTTTETTATATTSGASLVAVEHEEGEIEDDDDDEQPEYENISSDEEFIIRERLAQLQAMDTEMGLLNQITGHNSSAGRRNAYDKRMKAPPPPVISDGKENYECISDEEDLELYLRRYEPVPKPRPLPVRRKLRPPRSSESAKLLRQQYAIISSSSNSAGRQRTSREEPKRSRTLEKRKHEPRKQSLHRRHKRRKQVEVSSTTTVNVIESSDSERDFPLDRARLQAACSISTKKRKTDVSWNALRKKLQISIQKRKESQEVAAAAAAAAAVEVEEIALDDGDEEEDEEDELLQLRLSALKTKAELRETDVISLLEDTPEKAAEERELRLIALQSAFTKKHQIRLKKRQEERPYSPSDEIQLLSPVADPPGMAEIIDVDEDLQIVVTRPETVEIDDSSDDENRMEISPSVSPEEPRPDVQSIDMELVTSAESQSPAPEPAGKQQPEVTPQLDSPVSPANEEGDLQSKFPEEDDEESLRNQLLSNLSGSLPVATRPLTPDSMGEEEADALRELILSKMNNKRVTQRKEHNQTPPQASEISNESEISQNIPPADDEPPPPPSISSEVSIETQPSSKVSSPAVPHQSRVPTNPNLITLIGKQKIARKKKKKSAAKIAKQAAGVEYPPVAAIAATPPSRVLVKTPIPQVPAPVAIPPVVNQTPLLMVTTTKLVVNPNKLINLNTLNHSPKEHSAIVESYVQKPVPKLIIQLGQSESDSDPDNYPCPHSEPEVEVLRETFLRDLDNASPSRVTLESPTFPMSPVPTEAHDQPPTTGKTPDPAFALRLDQFLRTVRSQTDQNQNVTETALAKQSLAIPSAGTGSNGLGTGQQRPTATPRKLITAPTAPATVTPSAVRHLPKSQQLEYKRLLARMAHLEKQKQQRFVIQNTPGVVTAAGATLTKTIVNNGVENADGAGKNHEIVVTVNRDGRDVIDKSSPGLPTAGGSPVPKRDTDTLIKRVLINNTAVSAGSKVVPQAVVAPVAVQAPVPQDAKEDEPNASGTGTRQKSPTKAVKDNVPDDPDLATLREALRRLPRIREDDRHRVLKLAEARYENHSKRFREELQDLIGTVENAQYERQKQYDLENKVAFLREKLTVLERALSVHKHRIVSIFPTLQESHTRVMASRKKSIELNNLCQAIGRTVQGDGYSPPSGLRGEIHQQLKVLTSETKQLKHMKKLTLEEFKHRTFELRRRHQEELQGRKLVESSPAPKPEPCPAEPPKTVDEQTADSEEPPATVNSEEIVNNEAESVPMEVTAEIKPCARSAPASRSTSPLVVLEPEKAIATSQEAPAVLSGGPTWKRFEKYTSPLASLRSAPNIPDGVICPYQMRGECVDKECKFEHLK